MTNKLKRLTKLSIFALLVSLIFWACQKEETIEHDQEHETHDHSHSDFKRVNINDLFQQDDTFTELSKNYIPSTVLNKGATNKTTNRGLVITSDTINVIERENYKSYTIRIKREGFEYDTENLIIEENKGVKNAYILSYDFDNDWIVDYISGVHTPPQGTVSYSDFDLSKLSSKTITAKSSGSCNYLTITITTPCPCRGHYTRCGCYQQATSYTHRELICGQSSGNGGGGGSDTKSFSFLPTTEDGLPGTGGGGGGSGGGTPGPAKGGNNSDTSTNIEDLSEFVEFKVNALIKNLKLNTKQAKWIGNNIQESLEIYDFVAKENSWAPEAKEFSKWNIEFEILPKVPCGINHDCVKSIKTMAAGLRKFHGEEGKLMADYFDSLVADFNSFTRDDLQVFYDTAYDITTQYNARMRRAILGGFIEGVTPIIEIALFEVGGPVALKLLKKIPLSWVLRGTRLNNMVKKVGLLGKRGNVTNIRELSVSQPVSYANELFNTLTKNKIGSIETLGTGVRRANMGNGNYIIFRNAAASSSNTPATIELVFPNIYSRPRIIKFLQL